MSAECCAPALERRPPAMRRGRASKLAALLALAPAALVALAVPKCPVCLAAHVALVWAGVGATADAPLLIALGAMFAVLALGLTFARRGFVARRREPRGTRAT